MSPAPSPLDGTPPPPRVKASLIPRGAQARREAAEDYALRKVPGLACAYIAALTGWNDAQTRARVVASGFDKHLVKPPDVGVVLDLVDTCGQSHAHPRCA